MKSPHKMDTIPLAPKFWYGISATSLLLWICSTTASLLLCSCISGGADTGPAAGTPEFLLQANAAKWKPHSMRSYAIDYGTWSIDGTRTTTCEAVKGVVAGQCLSVYRCCGEDPETTFVDPPYPSPEVLLADFAKYVADLKYDSSSVTDTSLLALKTVKSGPDTLKIGYYAEFDRQYGYPTQLVTLGSALPSAILIKRIEFR